MTAQTEVPYRSVKNILAQKESLPSASLPIHMKSGELLTDVIPYGFVTKKSALESSQPTLELLYLDKDKKARRVDASQINGLGVVVEEGIPYLTTTYYKPQEHGSVFEEKPRILRIKTVQYGTHPNHLKVGELEDFYIVADDMNYVRQPDRTDIERNFPFWRLGIYGDPAEAQSHFQQDYSI